MQLHFENNHDSIQEYASTLPFFDNIYAAKAFYYEHRQEQLKLLEEITKEYDVLLDFSPKSLISLEEFYFHLFRNNYFFDIQMTIEEFETCMSLYLCEVLVTHHDGTAEWIVEEYPYADQKYVMGIRYGRFHQYFENLFPQFYLSHKDESQQVLFKRYIRMSMKSK
ncbi:hypothetical protein [Metabacillus litoralis]|uniref:hypothetical protein n=1 Tax=Metabacillus litoralis TaxID=152268 RepID=UPI00203EA87A|nr:hypothetical protein [Metabacillus litoralis]MCM3163807.1 hypothetical protein [Metabacillus litoralis]